MSPTCAVCAVIATHHCANDDGALRVILLIEPTTGQSLTPCLLAAAFLCEACNLQIHSANALSSRHRVVTVKEYLQMNVEPSNSQHSASNTTPILQPASAAPSSVIHSEGHQVVPTMDPSSMDAFKPFTSDFDVSNNISQRAFRLVAA